MNFVEAKSTASFHVNLESILSPYFGQALELTVGLDVISMSIKWESNSIFCWLNENGLHLYTELDCFSLICQATGTGPGPGDWDWGLGIGDWGLGIGDWDWGLGLGMGIGNGKWENGK